MAAGPVPAAVLVPLFMKEGECHVLFTKRTDHLNHHSGEFSFPGGVRSSEDHDLQQTALRETWEEVGIVPAEVEVLGMLDDFYSVHDYLVTPFVGRFPAEYQLTLNHHEIDRVIEVPLSHLVRPEIFRTEDWTWKGREYDVHFYSYGQDEIWGLTASILKQLLDLLAGNITGTGTGIADHIHGSQGKS
jgi:8-oxo-dGTP pyrophosphatase MutT (NUDIX family)